MELIEHLGGVADPAAPASASQLVGMLRRELPRGLAQITGARAGYDRPLVVPFAAAPGRLAVVVPVSARLRTDDDVLVGHPRAALLVASAIEALLLVADHGAVLAAHPDRGSGPDRPPGGGLVARYAAWEGALMVVVPWQRSSGPSTVDAELAAAVLEEHLAQADRLRVVPAALPADAAALVLGGVEPEVAMGHRHPLDALEVLLRAGLDPAAAVAGLDDESAADASTAGPGALLDAALGPRVRGHRPHEDPDPARRLARRMLQMLMGKRKWSGGTGAGYHTEVVHLTRGFEPRDRELAGRVVEALIDAGLLVEKTSVGQRHVSLLSRRAGEIRSLVERGIVPTDLHLP